MQNSDLDRVFSDFLTLKKLRRTGWQLRGMKDAESIADHCFGVVYLTYFFAPLIAAKLDRNKALSIAIVHEIGESRIGDIPYTTLKYFKEKSTIETQAVEDVLSPLGQEITDESLALFREFEEGISVEGRFVKAIDKLECLITAAEYEKAGNSGLKDFWENASTFKALEEFPELVAYALHLKKNRLSRLSGDLRW